VSTVLTICDELAALIESDATQRDDARARPPTFTPGLLYVWPASEAFEIEATGAWDQEVATIRVARVWDASFEQASGTRDRATTDLIVAEADGIGALVRDHRAATSWENADVTRVDYEQLTTLEARGYIAELVIRASRTD
jgi:hypothetical protein